MFVIVFLSLIARRLFLEFGTNHKITPVLRIARAALSETTGIVVELCNALVRLTSRFEFERKVGELECFPLVCMRCSVVMRARAAPSVAAGRFSKVPVARFIQQLRPESPTLDVLFFPPMYFCLTYPTHH